MSRGSKAAVALVVYATLLLLAALLCWRFADGVQDSFVKLLAAWFTVLTSALAAAVSLFVFLGQQDAAKELEAVRIKASAELESLRQAGAASLEALKKDFAKELKVVEFSMGQAGRASEAVSMAMTDFYYALAATENNSFRLDDLEAAESSMRKARARLLDLLPEATQAFDAFWQTGANIRGELRKAGATPQPAQYAEIWRRYVKTFGEQLKAAEVALVQSQKTVRIV